MKTKTTFLFFAAAGLTLLGCGCTKPADQPTPSNATSVPVGAKASLTVKGSDTMVQLAQAWAQEFMKAHPEVAVTVTGGGSNTGMWDPLESTCRHASLSIL